MRNPIVAAIVAALSTAMLIGGVAVAANTVGSSDIRDNSIRSRDVRDGTLRERDINEETVARFSEPGPQGEKGEQGEQGGQGPRGFTGTSGSDGQDGQDGQDGVSEHEVVTSPPLVFGPNGWGGWDCPEGKVATGGGWQGAPVASSRPHQPGDVLPHLPTGATAHGWSVQATNSGGTITVFVICALITEEAEE